MFFESDLSALEQSFLYLTFMTNDMSSYFNYILLFPNLDITEGLYFIYFIHIWAVNLKIQTFSPSPVIICLLDHDIHDCLIKDVPYSKGQKWVISLFMLVFSKSFFKSRTVNVTSLTAAESEP